MFGVEGGDGYAIQIVRDVPQQRGGNARTLEPVRTNLERLARVYGSYAPRWSGLLRGWAGSSVISLDQRLLSRYLEG